MKRGKITWNVESIKRRSRSKFIKEFEGVYPDVDLGAVYDSIVPPKKKKDEKKPED